MWTCTPWETLLYVSMPKAASVLRRPFAGKAVGTLILTTAEPAGESSARRETCWIHSESFVDLGQFSEYAGRWRWPIANRDGLTEFELRAARPRC